MRILCALIVLAVTSCRAKLPEWTYDSRSYFALREQIIRKSISDPSLEDCSVASCLNMIGEWKESSVIDSVWVNHLLKMGPVTPVLTIESDRSGTLGPSYRLDAVLKCDTMGYLVRAVGYSWARPPEIYTVAISGREVASLTTKFARAAECFPSVKITGVFAHDGGPDIVVVGSSNAERGFVLCNLEGAARADSRLREFTDLVSSVFSRADWKIWGGK